jgi:transcriptional regulator with XRE-family HTH domain
VAKEESQVSNEMNQPELDDILQWFVASVDRPDWASIQKWMARYPNYAHEIGDFAAAWILSNELPENPETAAAPLEHWTAIGRRAFERAVAEERAGYAASAPLTNLLDAAKQQGLNPAQLAAETGLSRTLLMKLDQRLIVASTIPARLVERIATVLNAPLSSVTAYLAQPAKLTATAQYRAEEAPTVQPQEPFATAVRVDKLLKPTERETLIAMTREDQNGGT